MAQTNEELWEELEHLIDKWEATGDRQSYNDKLRFIKDNSSNEQFRDFTFKRIMALWRINAFADPEARYDVLWRLLMYERYKCKSRFLTLDNLAIWIAAQWNDLLLFRRSMEETSYRDNDCYICAVASKNSLSSKLILCLKVIATECVLKLLEEMRICCLDHDKANIEEAIIEVKLDINKRKMLN